MSNLASPGKLVDEPEPILQITNLHKSFGALRANEDISLDLRSGEIHALIGPNGAGKTTLIKQIAGSLQVDSGIISFLGLDITKLDVVTRARLGLARTFQVSALAMDLTVLQNVVLGALGARGGVFDFLRPVLKDEKLVAIAHEALERVGLQEHAAARTAEISHGQRRQLEIAVALTMRPRAFLMDEPMAGLGAGSSRQLIGFLDELRNEAPILLVEHDMDAVFSLADRISVLVYGKLIATGTARDIRTNRDVRRAYLGEGTVA